MTDPDSDPRRTQIDEVVSEYVRRCSTGEQVDRKLVQDQHPELMPELANELAQRQLIAIARKNFERQAESPPAASPGQKKGGQDHAPGDKSSSSPSDAASSTSASSPKPSPSRATDDTLDVSFERMRELIDGGVIDGGHVDGDSMISTNAPHDSVETVQLTVRCPHCGYSVEIMADVPWSDITCIGCGQAFSLVSDGASTRVAPTLKQIAHFELIERIGVGGFGTVWKARDTILDRVVALKLPRRGQLTEEDVEKFLREARAAAQLRHPNIVSVHEVGRTDETVYIVSDLVRGVLLNEWAVVRTPSPQESAALVWQIASALDHAHQAGVVHRDLKPGNIMVDYRDRPHIMDFGLAKRDVGEVTVTIEGQVMGTPAYMAPEQARGESHLCSPRTDVYSIGVVLFELLTGGLPFRGNSSMLVHQVLTAEPPKPRALNNHVPQDLETICLRCLEKDPDRRFVDGGDLAAELERFVNGMPIHSRPVGAVTRAFRWCRRNMTVAGMAAAMLVTLILGTIVSTYFAMVATGFQRQATLDRFAAAVSKREALASREEADESRFAADKALLGQQRMTDDFFSGVFSSPYNRQLQSVSLLLQNPSKEAAERALSLLEDDAACPISMHDYTWRYLHRTAMRQVRSIAADNEPWSAALGQIDFLAFSPDYSDVAVASAKSIRLFDALTGREKRPIAIDRPVVDMAWSFDSKFLAFCDQDGSARLVRLQGGRKLEGMARSHVATSVAFRGAKTIWLGTQTGAILAVDVADLSSPRVISDDLTLPIRDLDYSVSGFIAIACGNEIVLRKNDETTPGLRLPGHGAPVKQINIARNGSFLVSTSDDGEVMRWRVDWKNKQPRPQVLCKAGSEILSAIVSSDTRTIATLRSDRIQLWDAKSGEYRASLRPETGGEIELIQFATQPQDQTHCLAIAGRDGQLRFMNGATAPRKRTVYGGGVVRSIACLPDGSHVVLAGDAQRIDRLKLTTLDFQATIHCPSAIRQLTATSGANPASAESTPAKSPAALAAAAGAALKAGGNPDQAMQNAMRALAINTPQQTSSARRSIAVVMEDGTSRVYTELERDELQLQPDLKRTDVAELTFFPDGRQLLRRSRGGLLWIDDLQSAASQPLNDLDHPVIVACVLESGRTVVGITEPGNVAVWQSIPVGTAKWQLTRSLPSSHDANILSIGRMGRNQIVCLYDDAKLVVVDLRSGETTAEMKQENATTMTTHAGTARVAIGVENVVHVWQLREGRFERVGQPMTEHGDAVIALSFTTDGKQVVSSSLDRTVKLSTL